MDVVLWLITMALLVAFLIFGSGCSTALPRGHMVTYQLNRPLTIHVCDRFAMLRFARAACLPTHTVGFTDLAGNIWIRRDPWNPALPDFQALGHELWHQPQLGGRFH